MQQRFPVSSDERKLITELRAERFTVDGIHAPAGNYQHWARYEVQSIPCRETWDVQWSAADGKISALKGSYRAVCL